jgi:hypothetical protein
MRNAIVVLIIVDAIIVVLSYLFGEMRWLINTQMAFIPSSLVMLGSMLSYKSMVQGRLNAGAIPDDERDTLDKLEDPYDLYDESSSKESFEDKEKSLVDVVKEERANLKKSRRSVWQTTKDAKASFSFYRLGAYLLLIVGFFYLNNNNLLDIPIYLLSLSLPMVVIVTILIRKS